VYEHIFQNHNLKPIHEFAVFNNSSPLIWPSVTIVLGFIIFIFLKITAYPKLINTFRSSYSIQAVRQMEREEFNPFNPTSFALSFLFVIMLSFFLYKLNAHFGEVLSQKSDLAQYLFFVLCICVFLPIKFGLKKIIGFVTDTPELSNEIFYNNLVINQSLGLVMLPIMAVLEFSKINEKYVLIATIILLFTGMCMKLYRGIVFSLFENHIGLLQVFIYLCALEILPFLVFIKIVITNF
jgi:hypothetical protein